MKNSIFSFLLILMVMPLFSQGDRAALQLDATDKGILIPRLTQEQKDTLAAKLTAIHQGLMIFNKESNEFCFWDSVAWRPIGSSLWEAGKNGAIFTNNFVGIGVDSSISFASLSVAGLAIAVDGFSAGAHQRGQMFERFTSISDSTDYFSGVIQLFEAADIRASSTIEVPLIKPKIELKARGEEDNFNYNSDTRDNEPELIMRNSIGGLGFLVDFENGGGFIQMNDPFDLVKVKIESIQADGDPAITLSKNDEVTTVILDANSDVGDGGSLQLYNNDGHDKVHIESTQSDGDPAITLSKNGDVKTVIIDGNSGIVGNGGSLQLNDGIGRLRILATAEQGGGSSNSRVQMFDEDNDIGVTLHSFEGIKLVDKSGKERINLFRDGDIYLSDASGNVRAQLYSNGDMQFRDAVGDTTIFIDSDLNGDGRIITQELEITGGSDVSEYFNIHALNKINVTPGTVVSIDENNIGELKISSSPYDKKVIGVVSGANGVQSGLMMGQKSSIAYGDYPVALMGRVYVRASTINGKIRPGDELTSSKIPGVAMKATKRKKKQGSVIGKAMSALDSDQGFVLVVLIR